MLLFAWIFLPTRGTAYSGNSDPIGRFLRGGAGLVTTKVSEITYVVAPEIPIAAVLAGDDGILVIDDLLLPWTQKIGLPEQFSHITGYMPPLLGSKRYMQIYPSSHFCKSKIFQSPIRKYYYI